MGSAFFKRAGRRFEPPSDLGRENCDTHNLLHHSVLRNTTARPHAAASPLSKIIVSYEDLHENHHMANRIASFGRDLMLSWVPNPVTRSAASFLWGPRQTGKTTLLHQQLPEATFYDLLDTELRAELSVRPRKLRGEILAAAPPVVVIDEIQEVPVLLDEVH